MGHAGSKTRSSAQILEKPCVRSRGHIFSQIIMTLSQNILLDKILDDLSLEKDHVGSKTRSLVQMLKNLVYALEAIFRQIIMKLGQNFCLDEIWYEYENGSCRIKN